MRKQQGLGRYILVEHIMGGTRSMWDDGCDVEGRPNQQRQAIIAALSKRVRIEDGDAAGGVREVPVFMLAETPKRFPWVVTDRRQATCAQRDNFDRQHLVDSAGRYRIADDVWHAEAQKLREAEAEKIRPIEERAKRQANARATEAFAAIIQLAEQSKAQAAHKGGKRVEATNG